MSIIKANQDAIDAIHAEINALRTRIALSDSAEEKQLLIEQVAEKKEELRKINRKAPVVVPLKDCKTVGDKMERRLKTRGRKTSSSYGRSIVRI